jgi:hypothetical protein
MSNNVLKETDLKSINEALKVLDQTDELLTRAEQAGIDVASQRSDSTSQRTRLQKLKQAFFPGR